VKAADLKCEKCGTGARDVDLSLEFNDKTAVCWTCQNGHKSISGWRPDATGLRGALDQKVVTYRGGARIDMETYDHEGRVAFLNKIDAQMKAAEESLSAKLVNEIYYSPPVFMGVEWVKPSHWAWRVKLRWWWLGVREWVAEKILRVDLNREEDE